MSPEFNFPKAAASRRDVSSGFVPFLSFKPLFGFFCVFVWAIASAAAAIRSGDTFPSLASAELTGAELPELQGQVVLVDFWASWCAPCKASFPFLAKLHTDYAPKGLVIVGVSVDDKPAAFSAFVKKHAPPFVAVHDAKKKLVSAVEVPAMPTTYVLDGTGRVRAVHAGFHGEKTERELRQIIESLLSPKN